MQSLKDAEDSVHVLGRDSDTIVAHAENYLISPALTADRHNGTPIAPIFDGVSDEILEHLG